MFGLLSVNMKQMSKFKVDADNIRVYDHIMKNKGKVSTLDARSYIEQLNEFGIFYTFKEYA